MPSSLVRAFKSRCV